MGAEGAKALAGGLTTNSSLQTLECAAARAFFASLLSVAADTSSPLPCSSACILYCFLGSLRFNGIGAEGAKAIGEALAVNQSLTSLKYAPHHKPAPFGNCQ